MNTGTKTTLAAALLMAALAGGLFLSGYLVLLLLGLRDVPQTWHTYWDYCRALDLAEVAPYVTKIKLGGYVGFGLPLLAWLGLLVPLFRPKEMSLHG